MGKALSFIAQGGRRHLQWPLPREVKAVVTMMPDTWLELPYEGAKGILLADDTQKKVPIFTFWNIHATLV